MSESVVIFKDFMRLALFFYKTIGIDPCEPNDISGAVKFWHYFNFLLNLGNLNFGIICEIVYVVRAFKNNEHFIEAIMMLSCMGYSLVGECKMISGWRQKTKLSELVQQLENMFPSQQQEHQRHYKVHRYLRLCRLVTRGFSGMYVLLIATYSLGGIIIYFVLWPNGERTLPYTPYAPWDWHDNWTFYPLYVSQAIAGFTATSGHISSDVMIYAVLTQVIMHFDYLATSFESYTIQAVDLKDRHSKNMQELQAKIIYHNKLLDFVDAINVIFGVPLLLNFFASSVGICFLGFQMSIGLSPEMGIKVAFFLASSLVQIYLICYFSQLLIDASANISTAVYNADWSGADVRYRKMLILIAQRAQRPVNLKATIFLDVSMWTMTEFVQMSYKFFALLRTLYRI
ncbi:odorant receptor 85c-like [Scaptodrosophila lebanonensis]|uniref:Odorant receptor n=1 Tax=Drosophila lebanonensis TaxID=7225 RepID=A0A6J2TJU5_DROLE|nr:odorant receptor 85c-like [Scaptodrosophila lebanonensis]